MTTSKKTFASRVLADLIASLGAKAIDESVNYIKTLNNAIIDIGEWDSAYNNINKMLCRLDKEQYVDNRTPTTHKDFYELSLGISYTIKMPRNNRIKVWTYLAENKIETRLKIKFVGSDKYRYRRKFLMSALKLTDKNHIKIQYLSENELTVMQQPHSFDDIVLTDDIKQRIVNGLASWKNSKDWYDEHQLVHKIGVLLHGQPGTGKSTIARAISTMFGNAPIMVLDPDNIMKSIGGIVRMRNRYVGTLIILIEDFDMYFKSREELAGQQLDIEQKKRKDNNQNAVFQLLDGVYSTDNTIYIATTNHIDRLDPALIRYGRFDIQAQLDYFDEERAKRHVKMLGYDESILDGMDIKYPAEPSYIQSKVMEYRANSEAMTTIEVGFTYRSGTKKYITILSVISVGAVFDGKDAYRYDLANAKELSAFILHSNGLGITIPEDWNLSKGIPENAEEISTGVFRIYQPDSNDTNVEHHVWNYMPFGEDQTIIRKIGTDDACNVQIVPNSCRGYINGNGHSVGYNLSDQNDLEAFKYYANLIKLQIPEDWELSKGMPQDAIRISDESNHPDEEWFIYRR